MEETTNDSINFLGSANLFVFKNEFFFDPNFKERFDRQMKTLRALILRKDDREGIKNYLNAFTVACFKLIKDEEMRMYMHLEFFITLCYYGEVFDSSQTFENIIKTIEQKDIKEKLFKKEPLRSFLVYGEILLKYYGLKNSKSKGWFTRSGFDTILKAKFYLLKAYTQRIEGKNKLSESDFSHCLVLLSACFMHLSRWFEPIFYLKLLESRDLEDPNFDYLTALNLDALKEKSCLDYNGQLLLRIFECSTRTIESNKTHELQKSHMKEIQESCSKDIQKAKLSIEKLRKHNKKIVDSKRRRNPYFTYCIENQLFLNEHSFFCNCRRSIGDSLEIKTRHSHTQIEWVKKFEVLLDSIVADFVIARQNIYQSESKQEPLHYYKKENPKKDGLQYRKDALLKNAFKICYSILDQICYGIFGALEIEIDKLMKEKSTIEKNGGSKVYFLNMWDLHPFTVDDFRNNLYLISLYSLAKDLDKTEYSALKSFKDYRNAMEHKILFIEGESNGGSSLGLSSVKVVSRFELLAKTKLLMVLTKSAIISYAYFVRRESRRKEMLMKHSKK